MPRRRKQRNQSEFIMMESVLRAPLWAVAVLLLLAGAVGAADAQEKVADDLEYTTTASGLKYAVLKEGDGGNSPSGADMVTVKFTISTEDGTLIQTSDGRRKPAEFRLNRVLSGWTEGIELMTVGAKYRLILTPELGYGPSGFPPKIKGDTTLIIEVELVSFEIGPELPQFKKGNPAAQKKTDKGLVYEVLRPGTGLTPVMGEMVQVRFAFWTEAGKLVDCSELRLGTMRFPVGRIGLKIYTEAALILKEGARYRFIVPPELVYGERGAGILVPPNATTIWEIELEKVLRAIPLPEFVMPADKDLVTTKSGLKYETVKKGTGPFPRLDQKVFVHFAGWTTDGKCFHNSFKDGEEKMFLLSRLIPGWIEALQLMKPGGVFRIVIPAEMAIGPRGLLPQIPKDAKTLVYYLELFRAEDMPGKKKSEEQGPWGPPTAKKLKSPKGDG
jgi:peptidylprolyl isomerase